MYSDMERRRLSLEDRRTDSNRNRLRTSTETEARFGQTRQARPRIPHLRSLDGLRALAVASVFAFHAGVAWSPGGFIGVDVFFVISGFLITALLLEEWRREATLEVWRFWGRRARRLLPALFTLLVAVWVVVPFLASEQAGRLRSDVWAALTYVSNWKLIFEHQSYFQSAGRPPLLQHLWSLAVEEQFYLLWPLVLWVGLSVCRRASRLTGWILAGALGSAALMAVLYTPGADPSRAYYGTDTRLGTILIGAALACVWAPWRNRREATALGRTVLGAAGVAALAVLAWCVAGLHQFDDILYRGGLVGVAAASAVLVAVATHHATPGLAKVLGSRPMVWLGRRSYGLYLVHWPVSLLTRPYYDVPLSGPALFGLRVALTVGLAALSYRFIEAPVRTGALGRLRNDLRDDLRRRTGGALGPLHGAGIRLGQPRRVAVRALGLAAVLGGVAAAAAVARTDSKSTAELALQASVSSASSPTTTTTTPTTTPTTAVASDTAPSPGAASLTTDPAGTRTTSPPPPSPAPPSQPAPLPSVTVLGDSVLLEAKAAFERRLPGVAVYAAIGRQFNDLLTVARSLSQDGQLGDEVVLQMGNNGVVTAAQFDEIMGVMKGVRRVEVLNVKVPRPWEPVNNEMLAARVGRWPNAVLVDWYTFGSAHPGVFAGDGTHPGPAGVADLVDLVISNL